MVGTIVYGSVNTQYRESAEDTGLGCFLNTFTNCRNIFLRNRTADNCGIELECLFAVRIHGLELNLTMSVLSTSTGLFCVFAVNINRLGKGFLVCNLRSTNVCFHLELTQKSVYDNFQMELAHTSDNCLSCFLIRMGTEGRVFFCQFGKSFTQFTLACFGLGLNSKLNNRFREFHGFQNYRMLIVTDGITGCGELKANCCSDIAGKYLIQLLSLVSMHLQDTSNTFLLILCCIQHIRTGVHSSRIHTEECKLTNKRVSHNLECQSGKRFLVRRMSFHFVSIQISSLNRRDVRRRRHILKHCIQKLLYTLVPVCGTAANRDSCTFACSFSQNCLKFFNRRFFPFQIHHH